ncbi:YncE family protein [Pontibacter locisalis]|uniref:YncE family protein n=1 Tax=Pontibacter locisalis TaxID=1719035 RepID=A0ABW5IK58_9BACT
MKQLKHLAAVALFTFSGFTTFAQGEKNNWYFGKGAGMIFSGDTAQATSSRLFTEEGSAVWSDKDGNLVLYTNGITVWNRDHKVMPNGNGLMGGKSSTQSALILPKPGSDNIYYIFTTDIQAQSDGLRYSIVDMNKDNGKGDLVYKNNFIIAPATEKLTAVKHSNGRDWWVLAHRWNSNGYMAFLINDEGVTTQPVMSMVGTVHGGPNRKAIGYLVPSPDGTRLAAALWNDDSNFEILKFDRSTGKVSDPILLKGFSEAYGVAFSPDGSKLYGTTYGKEDGKGQVVQFDLTAGNQDAIAKSAVVVGVSGSPKVGALQLGPDGRIYMARKDNYYLGVIHNPNQKGTASNYVDNGFHLGKQKSDLGLPNFPHLPAFSRTSTYK